MILYHLTRRANITSILLHGLLLERCGQGGIGIKREWNPSRIFLTDDLIVPIRQLGSACYVGMWVGLEVDCEGLEVHPHMTTDHNIIIPHEFVVYTDISACKIKTML